MRQRAGRGPTHTSLAAAAVLVLAASACGGGEEEGAAAQGETLDHVGELTLATIADPPIFSMLQPYVADEAGFFTKYGVDVDLRPLDTGVDAGRAALTGDVEMAISPTGPAMGFTAEGAEFSALLGFDNIDWLVGSVNPEIQDCADLAGEEIAVDSQGGARYSVLEIILDSCGLSIDDVETIDFPGPTAIQAVAAGQLDTSVIQIDDVYVIETERGEELNDVEWLIDIDPTQHYLVTFATDEVIEEEREQVVRTLAAMIEAVRYINDDASREDVVDIAEVHGHDPEVIEPSLDDFLELEFWALDRHGLPEEKIEATIDEQVRLGNIEEEQRPDYDDVVDLSLWEEAFELVEEHGEW